MLPAKRRKQRALVLESRAIEAFKQVHVWAEVAGEKIYAVADFVCKEGGKIVIEEVKWGDSAKLSANQKAVFQAALENGKVWIANTEVAERLGVKVGEYFGERVMVNLVASTTSRAAISFAGVVTRAVLGAAFMALSVGVQAATWSNDLAPGTMPCFPNCSGEINPRDAR